MVEGGGIIRGQRLARFNFYVTFTRLLECSNGKICYLLNFGNKEYREELICCIVDLDDITAFHSNNAQAVHVHVINHQD